MVLHLGDFISFTFIDNLRQGIVYYEGKHGYSVMTSYGSYPIRKNELPEIKILHRHKYPFLRSSEEVKRCYPEYFI